MRHIEEQLLVHDELGYLISPSFARERDWAAVPVLDEWLFPDGDTRLDRIAQAIQSMSIDSLFLDFLETEWPDHDNEHGKMPTIDRRHNPAPRDRLFRLSPRHDDLLAINDISIGNRLLVPDDAALAILITSEEHYVIAGPSAFVESATGAGVAELRRAFRDRADSWCEPNRSYYLTIAAHYEQI